MKVRKSSREPAVVVSPQAAAVCRDEAYHHEHDYGSEGRRHRGRLRWGRYIVSSLARLGDGPAPTDHLNVTCGSVSKGAHRPHPLLGNQWVVCAVENSCGGF